MEGLQQTHHPWLWYSPKGQRPPCSAVGSDLALCVPGGGCWAGDIGSGGVWAQQRCVVGQSISVHGPLALPGLVPWRYREEAETTEPSLTWHNSWFLALQGMDSSFFPMSHHSQSQWAPGCQVTVSSKRKSLLTRGLFLTMSLCKEEYKKMESDSTKRNFLSQWSQESGGAG